MEYIFTTSIHAIIAMPILPQTKPDSESPQTHN
jgi:hypothetical protein